ncbi:hypothetical protein GTY88_30315, partial [Streptomyces sp. SID5926]|nr:hypothetical protein [Streptomyces sp. SID5926]
MTEAQQPDQYTNPVPAHRATTDQPAPLADLVRTRLAAAELTGPVKTLVEEALGDGGAPASSPVGRVYLESVAVTRFRGIGPRTWLRLNPRP